MAKGTVNSNKVTVTVPKGERYFLYKGNITTVNNLSAYIEIYDENNNKIVDYNSEPIMLEAGWSVILKAEKSGNFAASAAINYVIYTTT